MCVRTAWNEYFIRSLEKYEVLEGFKGATDVPVVILCHF